MRFVVNTKLWLLKAEQRKMSAVYTLDIFYGKWGETVVSMVAVCLSFSTILMCRIMALEVTLCLCSCDMIRHRINMPVVRGVFLTVAVWKLGYLTDQCLCSLSLHLINVFNFHELIVIYFSSNFEFFQTPLGKRRPSLKLTHNHLYRLTSVHCQGYVHRLRWYTFRSNSKEMILHQNVTAAFLCEGLHSAVS